MGSVLGSFVCFALRVTYWRHPVVSGVLFLIGRYVPLAIVLSGPVIVNIITYHVTVQRIGAQLAVLATICWYFCSGDIAISLHHCGWRRRKQSSRRCSKQSDSSATSYASIHSKESRSP